jgi:ATP-dependent helicase HrpB
VFPVEEKIGEIAAALRANHEVVLTAPPGSGKTTCVPPALLDEPWLAGRKIVMLEPRRLAARNCATYIAKRRGEPVGETVGYQVRLERKVSSRTRLEVVTEGLLAQRILGDPELADVGLVIFDEFHERSLACDLAFALALEVRRAFRPDLRILVMSATLDVDEVMRGLKPADASDPGPRLVEASGRMFPVETRYLGEMSMAAAISKALVETDGDVLCFLPGEGEIKRITELSNNRIIECSRDAARLSGGLSRDAAKLLTSGAGGGLSRDAAKLLTSGAGGGLSRDAARGVEVLPLYGNLPKEEQDRVFAPSAKRKVILATSIAETSLTIEGITTVIDSGLMRVPRFSPGTGMTGLVTLPLTRDRAEQRRGRAGRVQAGVCYRLWSEASDASRPAKMMPEILDADLCSLVLTSAAWGAVRRDDLPWMTPPPASAWDQASGLLKMLGALDERGSLTKKGEAMAKLPMHPRLANMMLAWGMADGTALGMADGTAIDKTRIDGGQVVERAALLAAVVEEGGRSRETDIRYVEKTPRVRQLAKRFAAAGGGRWNARPTERGGAILRGGAISRDAACGVVSPSVSDGALLAMAYPDRVARNRGNSTFQMVSGRGAFLPEDDPLAHEPFLVCCELDDRLGDAKIFRACPIAEAEIEDLFGDQIREEPFCAWDRANERVKCVVRRKLGAMTLGEVNRVGAANDAALGEAIAKAMLDGVRQKGVENLPCWSNETRQLRARLAFLSKTLGEEAWPAPTDAKLLAALEPFVGGMRKWRDLEKLNLSLVFDALLAEAGHDRRELERLAPSRMEVPTGSHMVIHYEGDEPTVEVRLQECFGLMETPKVAGGRVPVVMTLLSPAHRPVQVTKDLAGFWKNGYPLVRKDMRGRYPRHYWPEDPFTAVATRRVRPRPN